MDIRTGFGYDIHELEEIKNSFLLLGKVAVEGDLHIKAHSDGDVLLHSLSNAILSALGKEDIGYYFPDNKKETEQLDSLLILQFALSEMKKEGYSISNAVVDILLQKPKLLPYRAKIKENLSQFLSIPVNRIGLSCNTGEHLDAVGKSQAVIVYSQVLLIKD